MSAATPLAPPLAEALREAAAEIEDTLDAVLPPEEGPEARLAAAMRYATLGGRCTPPSRKAWKRAGYASWRCCLTVA